MGVLEAGALVRRRADVVPRRRGIYHWLQARLHLRVEYQYVGLHTNEGTVARREHHHPNRIAQRCMYLKINVFALSG
jgi:hypothetical protein